MKKIVEHFLRYPIWANAFMLIILLLGISSFTTLRTSFFPESETNIINISVIYRGTSPKEIEEGLVSKIEDKIDGINGIDHFTSTSSENSAKIKITIDDKYNIDEVLNDVKSAVDMVSPWPAGAEAPMISKGKFSMPAIVAVITGTKDLWVLKDRAEKLKDDLLNDENITQVEIAGFPDREIAVEFSEDNLRTYNLTFASVAKIISDANRDVSGGTIKTNLEELSIRSYGKKADALRISNIILRSNTDGTFLRVGDVAKVIEKWSNTHNFVKYNKKASLVLLINQSKNEDLLAVADNAKKIIKNFRKKYPQFTINIPFDSTDMLRGRIDLLVNNGLLGLLLVFITLTFFLNIRIAFWVALGIPVSFAGTFLVGSLFGITINMLSLFGMILVVGILVDDAIVVAEQTFQGIEKGMHPGEASKWAVMKIMAPVFTSVMTTILAFLPFFFFEGRMGKMIWQMALIVVSALIFSLFESFFILPSHLSHSKGIKKNKPNKIRQKIENFYKKVTFNYYGKALKFVIHHKLAISMIPFAAVMLTAGLFKGGVIKMNQFPSMDREELPIDITLAAGTREQITDSILVNVEDQILQIADSLEQVLGYKIITDTRVSMGSNDLGDVGTHAGQLTVSLAKGEVRDIPSMEIKKIIRKNVKMPHIVKKYSFGGGGRWGKPISISLTSNNLKRLREAKNYIKNQLKEIPELNDIVDLDAIGPKEIHIKLKPKAYALGLTKAEIIGSIRDGFFGREVQRIQRGKDEITVWVRYNDDERKSISNLDKMFIKTRIGKEIPLSELITYKIAREDIAIKHYNGKREIKIEADLINTKISANDITQRIKNTIVPNFENNFHDVKFEFSGRANDNFLKSAAKSFIPALIGIIFILILVFRSWIQSLLIFFMIPLGVMGALWGHGIYGIMLTQLSIMGLIALTGIVINDSIVFVDQINVNLREGLKIEDAVYEAGVSRLRPILMTTITTVAGLMPLMLQKSFQAQFLIPMAVSISFGLLFGSMFILFLVPVLFLMLNSIRYKVNRIYSFIMKYFYGKEIKKLTREEVEPAVQEVIHKNYLMEDIE